MVSGTLFKGWGKVNRVRTSVVAASGVGLAVAVGVSACGSVQQLSAKDSVSKAVSSYSDAKSAKFVLSLDTTVADLNALARADGDEPMSASEQATLAKVLAGDVTLSVQAPGGKTFGDSSKAYQSLSDRPSITSNPQAYANALKQSGSVGMLVNYRGSGLAELRMVNGVVYAKADGPTILKLAGEPQSELDDALAGAPPALAPLTKAAHNQWVSIDLASALPSALKDLTPGGVPTPTASINPATIQNLLDSLKSAYRKNVTIKKIGSGDKGTEYQLSAPIKQIAAAVEPQLESLAGQLGDPAADLGADAPSLKVEVHSELGKLPNSNFDADVWVKDDKLTGFAVDVAQFDAKAAGHKVVLNVDVHLNGGAVSAPSGATALDVKGLIQNLQSESGDFSSGSGTDSGFSGTGGQIDAKALKQAGFSDAEIKQLQKEEQGSGSGK
jgi:hypothetical protein